MKKSIVWLASYPKSGNTWLRIFLANYLMNADRPVPINQVHRFGMGDSITRTYNIVAGRQIDPNDFHLTLSLRDKVLRGIVGNNADVNFVKTHNIRAEAHGVTLIPDALTRSAVYILRNPLDMLLSYARHFGLGDAAAAEAISRSDNVSTPEANTVMQFLGGWSEHVESWTRKKAPWPRLVLRYEDLLAEPEQNFGLLLRHIGMPVDEARLEKAIRFASFDELAKQEESAGFVERSPKAERFFAKGKSGQWKTDLAPEIVERIRRDHGKVMERHGYLDE